MEKENLLAHTREMLRNEGVLEQLSRLGSSLFLVVTGSHGCGYASKSSDIDVKGAYIAPTEGFLGLRTKATEPTFEYRSEKLDVSVDEIGQYFDIVTRTGGTRLEWPSSRMIVSAGPDFEEFKSVVKTHCPSKKQLRYYLKFARDIIKGEKDLEGYKRDLYALKTLMSGIVLFEQGIITGNIQELNGYLSIPLVDELVEARKNDREHKFDPRLNQLLSNLDARLLRASRKSNLPDEPNRQAINDYLVDLRAKKFLS